VPDSGQIELYAYLDYSQYNNVLHAGLPIHGNSAVWVDALSFDTYVTGIGKVNDITGYFKLIPNVNNGNFHLQYELPENNYVSLKIYDMNAREVMNLYSGNAQQGLHNESYDASSLANGTYLLMLASDKGYHTEKLIIQK
jgi:hypothetical protein